VAIAAPRLVQPARAGAQAEAPVSNVIVYLIDTLRSDRTSTYGYHRPTTPNLDRLAREGFVFENAYSVASWTRPAVASLFTALYPSFHGVEVTTGLSRRATTLAERFRSGGWSTAAFVGNVQIYGAGLELEQGFDRFFVFPGWFGPVPQTWEINQVLLPHLEEARDEPFFLYVHAMDPHAPYSPPSRWRGHYGDSAYGGPVQPRFTQHMHLRPMRLAPDDLAYVRDLYDEDVRYQDAMLGELLDALERTGLDRTTLVVVVADHGEELFERGDWEHGERLFEELIRIPLVVRVPGAPALAGRRVAAPVQIVDLMPTLLGRFALPGAGGGHGRDLFRTALAPASAGAQARPVYCEELRGDRTFDLYSWTDGGWKLIRMQRHGGGVLDLLYDLGRDPGEQRSVAGSEPERLASLQRAMAAFRDELRARDPGLAAPAAGLDDNTRRRLEALGYVAPGPAGAP
jgi:arylsulfatase A-like enzyme